MWKCKECGETEITAVYSGDWIAYKKVIGKLGETEKISDSDMQNIGGYIYEYECECCDNRSENLEDIAEWVE